MRFRAARYAFALSRAVRAAERACWMTTDDVIAFERSGSDDVATVLDRLLGTDSEAAAR